MGEHEQRRMVLQIGADAATSDPHRNAGGQELLGIAQSLSEQEHGHQQSPHGQNGLDGAERERLASSARADAHDLGSIEDQLVDRPLERARARRVVLRRLGHPDG